MTEVKENPPDRSQASQIDAAEGPSAKGRGGLTRRKVLKGAVAATSAPPSLRRIAMPSALAKTSPGKEDGEKDPATDKSGDKTGDKTTDKDPGEKDPQEKTKETKESGDKDPQTDKTEDKDPVQDKTNDKTMDKTDDKTTDKDPFEKDPGEKIKDNDSSQDIRDLPKLARMLFDEWKS